MTTKELRNSTCEPPQPDPHHHPEQPPRHPELVSGSVLGTQKTKIPKQYF
ncbi:MULTISPECIES: hypothetical protein [unclassified Colwellia]|nr:MULTISPECIES: hypothetical protein [unclassified Colwellia]MBA6379111.1 hypothetical protein [Colwellia sp. BRX10-7]MBA6387167.1 hypothetical protein [Colwellia sp. BRX10-2]MBA6400040.1 hypothetical protein [Colwellia sp. BRX10-5]MBA6403919.1 hypothetical protein [Colwellia sp. BRX10-1]